MNQFIRKLAVAAFAVLALALLAPGAISKPARAATVTVIYDPIGPDAVNPCAPVQMLVCADGADQTPLALAIVQSASDQWADIIKDAPNVEIRVSWLDPAVSSKPVASVVETNGQGRVTVGRVRFPPNAYNYFYDPTPLLDEEFLGRRTDDNIRLASGMMRPKLYRTLHPDEKSEAFLNNASEIVEVGYNGLEQEPPGMAEIGTDFLSHALHEVGHLFGLSGDEQGCNPAVIPSGYVPPLALTGGVPVGIKAYQYLKEGVQALDCHHLAAGGITSCKPAPGGQSTTSPDPSTQAGLTIHDCTSHQGLFFPDEYPGGRQRPSVVDILAVTVARGWEQVDLPRKYSLGAGGAWSAAGTWFGNRAPDSGDDVYVVNQLQPGPFTTVTSAANASARNLFVSDENRVHVTGAALSVGRTVWLAGPDSREGPVRPIGIPPAGGDLGVAIPSVPSTLEVAAGAFVNGDRLGVEPGARLRLQGGQAQFGAVINSGSIQGKGTLGVARSLENGTSPAENGSTAHADGVIRAEGGLLRIVTPMPGGIVTSPPLVDLDGPSGTTAPTAARILAIDGDLEFDAMIAEGFWADVRIGSERTLRFVRNGIQQNASDNAKYALRFEGGAAGATLDAPPSKFHGIVMADGIGRFTGRVQFTGYSASVRLALGGTTPGVQHDQIQVQDVAELGGTLQVSLKGGFVPAAGQSFNVLTYESRIGQFDTVNLPALPVNLSWKVEYLATSLRLTVVFGGLQNPVITPVNTDVDGDGDTDNADMLAIIQHFGPCPAKPAACPWDLTKDGVVNQQDLLLWLDNA